MVSDNVTKAVRQVLDEAMDSGLEVTIHYTDSAGAQTTRTVVPEEYLNTATGGTLLSAMDVAKGKYRRFHLGNISSAI